MTIALVSGSYTRYTISSGSNMSFNLAQTPTQGNVLIAVIGTNQTSGSETVSSITQTGVTWSPVIQNDTVVADEIWMGTVGSGASTSVSIALAQTVFAAVADICEWSGISSNPVDKTQPNNGSNSTQTDTGTTATTTQANELFIGTVGVYGQAQSSPTNSFTMLDGAYLNVTGGISVSYLYKIVSSTGTANSGTTIASSSNAWQGCIATFKAASTTTHNLTISAPSPSNGGTTSPSTGTYSITAGTYQDVTTSANSGYTFDHWMLDSSNIGNTNPYSVLMNSDHTLQAVFASSDGSLIATAPLQLSGNVISIPPANTSTNGYLTSSDWNAFHSKQDALTTGNLTGTTNQINVTNGTGAVIGSGVTLSLPQDVTIQGYLYTTSIAPVSPNPTVTVQSQLRLHQVITRTLTT